MLCDQSESGRVTVKAVDAAESIWNLLVIVIAAYGICKRMIVNDSEKGERAFEPACLRRGYPRPHNRSKAAWRPVKMCAEEVTFFQADKKFISGG